ncbi:MAG: hypothetical protein AAGJ18_16305 [Bacteroidota bacterium]
MSTAAITAKENTIPSVLIYEMDNGEPIYYRGYREVLNKTKTTEEIMGNSALQSLLTTIISGFLFKTLPNHYRHFVSKLGFKFNRKSWRSLDIAIYDLTKIEDIDMKNIKFLTSLLILFLISNACQQPSNNKTETDTASKEKYEENWEWTLARRRKWL